MYTPSDNISCTDLFKNKNKKEFLSYLLFSCKKQFIFINFFFIKTRYFYIPSSKFLTFRVEDLSDTLHYILTINVIRKRLIKRHSEEILPRDGLEQTNAFHPMVILITKFLLILKNI